MGKIKVILIVILLIVMIVTVIVCPHTDTHHIQVSINLIIHPPHSPPSTTPHPLSSTISSFQVPVLLMSFQRSGPLPSGQSPNDPKSHLLYYFTTFSIPTRISSSLPSFIFFYYPPLIFIFIFYFLFVFSTHNHHHHLPNHLIHSPPLPSPLTLPLSLC